MKKTISLKRLLFGPRLHTAEMPHQTIGKSVGLAIFASDALSSTAYATEEILLILILAGTAALNLSLPIAIAIIILLGIVTISYNQTIHAYPNGGGAYIVARDNLPLYAIGVFLSFTISQIGMAVRWFRCGRLEPGEESRQMSSTLQYNPRWKTKLIINSIGAFSTFIVMIVFAVTKFVHGAWIVIFLIPLLVYIFSRIHNHYKELEAALSLETFRKPPYVKRHRVIVPISSVHKGTMKALHYARTLSNDITAVHVLIDPDGAGRIKATWDYWGDGVRLEVIESPYRLLLEPLVEEKIFHGAKAVGVAIKDLKLPPNCTLSGILRRGDMILPRGDTLLQAEDEVLALVDDAAAEELARLLGRPKDFKQDFKQGA